ncbi:MAG: hypothetical protein V5A87_01575 [Candidatus Bipolaricaulota bacterium]|nr:hypothetical protein [Candidatus Bipolaricaulota bacterium]MBS3791767.1 hypothetical protein [Candidatus Bipolaricaulota bacterium]
MSLEFKLLVFPLFILFLLTSTFVTLGHKYLETEGGTDRGNPVLVPDHQISWAVYEELKSEDQMDYYRFTAKSGEEIYAGLLIPKIDRYSNFKPDLALIGPGLEGGMATKPSQLPLDVRDGEDLLVKRYEGNNTESFFEPFTQTNYWEHQVIRKRVTEAGTYHIAVWNQEGKAGKYVLAIGEKEAFGPRDILEYPSVWWKVRIHNEKELSTYLVTGTIIAGAIAGSYLLFKSLL